MEVGYTGGHEWPVLEGRMWATEQDARQWMYAAWQGPAEGDWPAGAVGMRLVSRSSDSEAWQPLGH